MREEGGNDLAAATQRLNARHNEELLKKLSELARDPTFTQWITNGARKIDNLPAENIKAHGGKFMDARENLVEENSAGKIECGGAREKIGTNVYDKGDTCETSARKREEENP